MRAAATPYVDVTLHSRRLAARAAAQRAVSAAWQAATANERQELEAIEADAHAMVEGYRERLERLADELDAELAPLAERLEVVRQAAQVAAATLAASLPDCPEPSVTVPDESGWLFDSSRDYLDQLDAYRAHRHGTG